VVSDAVGWSSLFVSANLQQHYHFLGDVAGHKIGVQAGVEPTIDCFIFY
jgi:hypothetical protein